MPFTVPTIPPLDLAARDAALLRQGTLTKPPGSLGRLEALAVQLAAITGNPRPRISDKSVIVMAADHGVTAEGVSAFPSAVTAQMVLNFLNGRAAVNVLARQANARVVVVDIGVDADFSPHPALEQRKIARGTRNFAFEPAMAPAEAIVALETGIAIAAREADRGCQLIATGEMGIGNTTASAAIVAALTGARVAEITGRGTGIDDAGLAHKIAVIENALKLHNLDHQRRRDPLNVLATVGGLEIAGLCGVILGAAARRVPVVIDGFISGAAALLAAAFAPESKEYMIAAHRSVEIGHGVVLQSLGLTPLLDLDLRLGEGTGSVLAFHLIDAAVRLLDEMATFAEAGVANRVDPR